MSAFIKCDHWDGCETVAEYWHFDDIYDGEYHSESPDGVTGATGWFTRYMGSETVYGDPNDIQSQWRTREDHTHYCPKHALAAMERYAFLDALTKHRGRWELDEGR